MPRLLTKRASWIITIPVILVSLAYALGFHFPLQKSLASLRFRLERERQFALASSAVQKRILEIEQEIEEAKQYVLAWKAAAPDDRELTWLFAALSSEAQEAGVKVTRFDPQEPKDLNWLSQVPLTLSLEGEHAAIVDMLISLESLPETIWVQQIRLRLAAGADDQEANKGAVECEANLVVFSDQPNSTD